MKILLKQYKECKIVLAQCLKNQVKFIYET